MSETTCNRVVLTNKLKAMKIDKTVSVRITVHKEGSFIGKITDHANNLKDCKAIARSIIGHRTGRFNVSVHQDGGYFETFNLKA